MFFNYSSFACTEVIEVKEVITPLRSLEVIANTIVPYVSWQKKLMALTSLTPLTSTLAKVQ